MLLTRGLKRSFTQGDVTIEVLRGVDLDGPAGRDRRAARPVRLGQVDPAPGGRPARRRLRGVDPARWPRGGRSSTMTAAPSCAATPRLRLPVPPSAARVRRARECDAAAAGPWRRARRGAGARRGAARHARPRRSGSITGRPSCRAASSSASPSPGRSPTARRWCSPTSPPATSTKRPPTRVLAEFLGLVRGEGSAALVATHNERLAAQDGPGGSAPRRAAASDRHSRRSSPR